MKHKYFLRALALAGLFSYGASAQTENVGIGTVKPDESALLDLNSSNKGLLIPRLTLDQRNAIPAPAQGLMVYQTGREAGFYFFNGSSWKPMSNNDSEKSVLALTDPWKLGGNDLTTDPTAFIGTTNNASLVFKVNNTFSGLIDASAYQQTFLGVNAGSSYTNSGASGYWNVALGYNSLRTATTGKFNTGLGAYTLELNNGDGNTAIGALSLYKVTSGNYNMGLGSSTLRDLVSGSGNSAVGVNALIRTQGSNNTALGYQAGINKSGSGNIYIGYFAGADGTSVTAAPTINEDNKLYIANTPTLTPLIYGDFSAKYVTIGDVTPALRTQGVATGGYNLLVKGGILTEKVKVAVAAAGTDWADYVFEPSYKLMSLEKVEQFTKENKHLPNVPSADQLAKDGLDLGQTSKMFMEKIEELTLYIIEMNKEIKALKAENSALKK